MKPIELVKDCVDQGNNVQHIVMFQPIPHVKNSVWIKEWKTLSAIIFSFCNLVNVIIDWALKKKSTTVRSAVELRYKLFYELRFELRYEQRFDLRYELRSELRYELWY